MTGTGKQVKWAEDIKEEFKQKMVLANKGDETGLVDKYLESFLQEELACWWIEHRKRLTVELEIKAIMSELCKDAEDEEAYEAVAWQCQGDTRVAGHGLHSKSWVKSVIEDAKEELGIEEEEEEVKVEAKKQAPVSLQEKIEVAKADEVYDMAESESEGAMDERVAKLAHNLTAQIARAHYRTTDIKEKINGLKATHRLKRRELTPEEEAWYIAKAEGEVACNEQEIRDAKAVASMLGLKLG